LTYSVRKFCAFFSTMWADLSPAMCKTNVEPQV
jgi:hypothetical protein